MSEVLNADELKSIREWLASWGDGPNWSDATGVSVPMVKRRLTELLNTVEHWKRRAAQHGCDTERGDHECG